MTEADFPELFKTGSIGAIEVRNRFVTAPMTRISAEPDGTPNRLMKDYYRAYAEGGFGLLMTEGTYPDEAHSQGYRGQAGNANAGHREAWKPIVEAVHEAGGKFIQQLMHAGALIQHNAYGAEPIAPSAIRPKSEMAPRYHGDGPFAVPREMTSGDIQATIDGFAAAAERAIAAGFDGVEIHGANGYICDQFLTDYTNQRRDAYGGPLQNRLRFHCQVLAAVKDAVGGRGAVGIRISQTKINDHHHQWAGGIADAKIIFETLAAIAPDYIHISTHKGLEPVFGTERHLASFAKQFAQTTVIACGALHDPARANGILANGEADFVAIAKGALADPALPNKIKAGETPTPFDAGMISPLATIQNTLDWKAKNLPGNA